MFLPSIYTNSELSAPAVRTGMMEQWNGGMMGLKRKKTLEFHLSLFLSPLAPNIPLFQHSIIPPLTGAGRRCRYNDSVEIPRRK